MVEKRIKKTDIPEYVLRMFRSGACDSLVPGSYYFEGDEYVICCDETGLISIDDYVKYDDARVLSGFKSALKLLRSIVESCRKAGEYLVPDSNVSLELDEVFFDPKSGAKLVLGTVRSETFSQALCRLCGEINERYHFTNADAIAEKIAETERSGRADLKMILRVLSTWESELN